MIRVNGKRKTRAKNKKSDEVMSIGPDGLPQRFKIVRLNAKPPYDRELVPIYVRCACCDMAVGRTEEELAEELSGYCIGCFKNATQQMEPGPFSEFECPKRQCCSEQKVAEVQAEDPIKIKVKQSRSPKMKEEKKNGRL